MAKVTPISRGLEIKRDKRQKDHTRKAICWECKNVMYQRGRVLGNKFIYFWVYDSCGFTIEVS